MAQTGQSAHDFGAHLSPRTRTSLASLGHQHNPLGAVFGVGDGKGSNTPFSHAPDFAGHFFKLLGVDVVAGLNDDVLDAPGDVQFAVG